MRSLTGSCCCLFFVLLVAGGVAFAASPSLRQRVTGRSGPGRVGPGDVDPPPPYLPLTERLSWLAAEAYQQLAVRYPPKTAKNQYFNQRTADLVAALRLYRDVINAAYPDNMIEAGLSDKPVFFLEAIVEQYQKVSPRTPDVDKAIAIIQELDRTSAAGVYVAAARLVLGR